MVQTVDLKWVVGKLSKLDPKAKNFDNALDRLGRRVVSRLRGKGGIGPGLNVAAALWDSGESIKQRLAVYILRRFGALVPQSTWQMFRRWIEQSKDPLLQDAVSEWLVGTLVTLDRSWLRVLRDWTDLKSGPLRRAGVLAVLLRVRQMSDVEAAFMIAEPLMRETDGRVQEAVRLVIREANKVDEPLVSKFVDRWSDRGSSWMIRALPEDIEDVTP
jgi:3-methyladenine DNA glycosylase AlkD